MEQEKAEIQAALEEAEVNLEKLSHSVIILYCTLIMKHKLGELNAEGFGQN